MAMHDHLAVVECRVEELVSYPEQVLRILLCHRYAWSDPGVDEQEITADEAIAQTLQEKLMSSRKNVEQGVPYF